MPGVRRARAHVDGGRRGRVPRGRRGDRVRRRARAARRVRRARCRRQRPARPGLHALSARRRGGIHRGLGAVRPSRRMPARGRRPPGGRGVAGAADREHRDGVLDRAREGRARARRRRGAGVHQGRRLRGMRLRRAGPDPGALQLQQPARRVPRVPRLRPRDRHRPDPGGARPRADARRRRGEAVRDRPRPRLAAPPAGVLQGARDSDRCAVSRARRGCARAHHGRRPGLRRRAGLLRAARAQEVQDARARLHRALPGLRDLPGVPRDARAAGSPGVARAGPDAARDLGHAGRAGRAGLRGGGARRGRGVRPPVRRDRVAPGVSARRGPGLPHAEPPVAHALGRGA